MHLLVHDDLTSLELIDVLIQNNAPLVAVSGGQLDGLYSYASQQ
jgi:hypothetical protein